MSVKKQTGINAFKFKLSESLISAGAKLGMTIEVNSYTGVWDTSMEFAYVAGIHDGEPFVVTYTEEEITSLLEIGNWVLTETHFKI